ncbi:hypothetical protein D3C87_950460 [compost metagenome]
MGIRSRRVMLAAEGGATTAWIAGCSTTRGTSTRLAEPRCACRSSTGAGGTAQLITPSPRASVRARGKVRVKRVMEILQKSGASDRRA